MDCKGRIWTEGVDPKSVHWRKYRKEGEGCSYTLATVRENHGPLYRVVECPECGRTITEGPDGKIRSHQRPGRKKHAHTNVWCTKGG